MASWTFCDEECQAPEGGAECVACILGVSKLELRDFQVFLEAFREKMHEAGLSLKAIESIIDAVTG